MIIVFAHFNDKFPPIKTFNALPRYKWCLLQLLFNLASKMTKDQIRMTEFDILLQDFLHSQGIRTVICLLGENILSSTE